ncbi:MAG: M23 family metallopeptidase [Armatimonadetes bacterium]|nr:M23 family metallopeptidase [Armatimonadota bacterium]
MSSRGRPPPNRARGVPCPPAPRRSAGAWNRSHLPAVLSITVILFVHPFFVWKGRVVHRVIKRIGTYLLAGVIVVAGVCGVPSTRPPARAGDGPRLSSGGGPEMVSMAAPAGASALARIAREARPGPLVFAIPPASAASSRSRSASARSRMRLPSRGAITSRFGPRRLGSHHGVDIRAAVGTPVRAALAGTVAFAGWYNGVYGNFVIIRHLNGLVTRYAHNSKVLVRRGQRVAQGQAIARSGNTGRTTGPHIHFEVLKNGRAVNPLQYAR